VPLELLREFGCADGQASQAESRLPIFIDGHDSAIDDAQHGAKRGV
jgi:hypothetical protein